jgi:hypothetical protein
MNLQRRPCLSECPVCDEDISAVPIGFASGQSFLPLWLCWRIGVNWSVAAHGFALAIKALGLVTASASPLLYKLYKVCKAYIVFMPQPFHSAWQRFESTSSIKARYYQSNR